MVSCWLSSYAIQRRWANNSIYIVHWCHHITERDKREMTAFQVAPYDIDPENTTLSDGSPNHHINYSEQMTVDIAVVIGTLCPFLQPQSAYFGGFTYFDLYQRLGICPCYFMMNFLTLSLSLKTYHFRPVQCRPFSSPSLRAMEPTAPRPFWCCSHSVALYDDA